MIHTATTPTTRHYPTRKPQAAYHAALELVGQIDEQLDRGRVHYRTRRGILLTTLDEVVTAILSGDLMGAEL